MRALVLALLLAVTPALAAPAAPAAGFDAGDVPRDTDPVRLALDFCTGLATGDMRPLADHFAPALKSALAGVPPENVPWGTWPERPGTCRLEVLNGTDSAPGVLVQLTYVTGNHVWSDTLAFERTPRTWLLNNVFYETGGNLRFRLFSD